MSSPVDFASLPWSSCPVPPVCSVKEVEPNGTEEDCKMEDDTWSFIEDDCMEEESRVTLRDSFIERPSSFFLVKFFSLTLVLFLENSRDALSIVL